MKRIIWFFLHFGYQQAMSCLFPVFIFGTLALSHVISIPGLPRYDFILLACIGMQVVMVWSRLETVDELKVITVFHLIGLALEIFKVHMGSWAYPEEGYSKIFGVPLYSGFMYASVASYLCQAWRRLDVSIEHWPHALLTVPLGAAIYFNFFVHHFWIDVRWVLTGLIFLCFWKTKVYYQVNQRSYWMPLSLSFILIGFFIWLAENIATLLGAWQYPNQQHGWQMVGFSKISSWFLLVIVSFIIVAQLKHVKSSRSLTPDDLGNK